MRLFVIRWLVVVAAIFCLCASAIAKPVAPAGSVKVDAYLTRIYKINPHGSSFRAIVWLAVTSKTKRPGILSNITFVNAEQQTSKFHYSKHNYDGTFTEYAKYNLTISHHFNLARYPFDSQILSLRIEDAQHDISATNFIFAPSGNKTDSIVAKDALPIGWKVMKVDPIIKTHTYNTNFSHFDRALVSRFSQLDIRIFIKRHNARLFFSLFTMLYLAYLLSLFALIIPSTVAFFNTTAVLLAASVFSLVGNFLISDKILVHTLTFTIVDKIQLTTLIMMLLTYLILICNSYLSRNNKVKLANKIRITSVFVSVAVYVAINMIIIR